MSVCYNCDTLTHRRTDRRKKIEFMSTDSLNSFDFIQLDSDNLLTDRKTNRQTDGHY